MSLHSRPLPGAGVEGGVVEGGGVEGGVVEGGGVEGGVVSGAGVGAGVEGGGEAPHVGLGTASPVTTSAYCCEPVATEWPLMLTFHIPDKGASKVSCSALLRRSADPHEFP